MAAGTVKWLHSEKGFGFIEQDGGGADVFAPYSNIAAQGFRELQEGQVVTFDVTQGQKGPQAENINPYGFPRAEVITAGLDRAPLAKPPEDGLHRYTTPPLNPTQAPGPCS